MDEEDAPHHGEEGKVRHLAWGRARDRHLAWARVRDRHLARAKVRGTWLLTTFNLPLTLMTRTYLLRHPRVIGDGQAGWATPPG